MQVQTVLSIHRRENLSPGYVRDVARLQCGHRRPLAPEAIDRSPATLQCWDCPYDPPRPLATHCGQCGKELRHDGSADTVLGYDGCRGWD